MKLYAAIGQNREELKCKRKDHDVKLSYMYIAVRRLCKSGLITYKRKAVERSNFVSWFFYGIHKSQYHFKVNTLKVKVARPHKAHTENSHK